MAYTRTYYFNFESQQGLPYRVELYDQGSGAAGYANTQGSLGKTAVNIKYGSDGSKMFAPLKPSSMVMDFLVTNTTDGNYIHQLRTNRQERDVYVGVYRENVSGINNPATAPIWSGFILMDLADDPDINVPYPMTLKAVDGIASLKYYDFVPDTTTQTGNGLYDVEDTFKPDSGNNGGIYPAFRNFRTWLILALNYCGPMTTTIGNPTAPNIKMAARWYNGEHDNTTDNPLEVTRCTPQAFYKKEEQDNGVIKYKAKSCYDVIKAICKTWGMRCFMWKNSYYFIQLNEFRISNGGTYANPTNIRTFKYSFANSLTGTTDYIDAYWGRYDLTLLNGNPNPQYVNNKKSGGQYGILPAFKRVEVDLLGVEDANYFQKFPLLPDPLPTYAGGGSWVDNWYFEPLATFTFDSLSDRAFYQKIFLNFTNSGIATLPSGQQATSVEFVTEWLLCARVAGTGSNTGTDPDTDGWTHFMYFDVGNPIGSNNPPITWYAYSHVAIYGPPFSGFFNCPVGNSTHQITGAGNDGQAGVSEIPLLTYNNTQAGAVNFAANDYEFGYWIKFSQGSATNCSGQGRCIPQPWSSGSLAQGNYPDANGITYTNTVGSALGSSQFAPLVNGAVGSNNTTTTIVQSGDDTAFEKITDILWGDSLSGYAAGAIQVYDGTNWVWTDAGGFWGLDTLAGTKTLAQQLATDIMNSQAESIKKFNVTTALDPSKDVYHNDGSGNRPLYPCPFTKWNTPTHADSFTIYNEWIMHTGSYDIINEEWKWLLYEQQTFSPGTTLSTSTNSGYVTGTAGGAGNAPRSFPPPGNMRSNPTSQNTQAIQKLNREKLSPIAVIAEGQYITSEAADVSEVAQTITSLTVQTMPEALLKEGDSIQLQTISPTWIGGNTAGSVDLVESSIDGPNVLYFTVDSDQAVDATSISVVSQDIYRDIHQGDIIAISPKDLVAQYQHKTKGTIGDMTVTATTLDGATSVGREYVSMRCNANNNDENDYYCYYGEDNNKSGTMGKVNANAPTTIGTQLAIKAARYFCQADFVLEGGSIIISATTNAVITFYIYKATPSSGSSTNLTMTQIATATITGSNDATPKMADFTSVSAATIDKGDLIIPHAVVTVEATANFRGQIEMILIRK